MTTETGSVKPKFYAKLTSVCHPTWWDDPANKKTLFIGIDADICHVIMQFENEEQYLDAKNKKFRECINSFEYGLKKMWIYHETDGDPSCNGIFLMNDECENIIPGEDDKIIVFDPNIKPRTPLEQHQRFQENWPEGYLQDAVKDRDRYYDTYRGYSNYF